MASTLSGVRMPALVVFHWLHRLGQSVQRVRHTCVSPGRSHQRTSPTSMTAFEPFCARAVTRSRTKVSVGFAVAEMWAKLVYPKVLLRAESSSAPPTYP